ncbi:Alpha/beta hydrolase family-domain-containing protein [Cristinia sonorae]|uniref:Alpha/beta hydrolase family-domain-containing protein n=1 Tax=Cristinia sonorae TaxID=1940300 RepID=A0A8K0UGK1_9AGAR|nr:Alpha/beta hydrolase family-domain-containing protein [Cristinia sonorae]
MVLVRSLSLLVLALSPFVSAETIRPTKPVGTPHYRDYFYVGGQYVSQSGGTAQIQHGQLYVEHLTPSSGVTKKYPLLFVHGAGMTGTNFLNTPDGRLGWADWFLGQGYEVYLVDQPARGRSAYQSAVDGPQFSFSNEVVQSLFTSPAITKLWPQSILHTQWPGLGAVGDAVFDKFFASLVPLLATNVESATKNKAALTALVDKIGPVHLVTHSQSGEFGWNLADARPNLIRSIVGLEPAGPPFAGDATFPSNTSRLWGLTDIPITYSPPLSSPDALNKDKILVNDPVADNFPCYAQSPPIRTLPNLAQVPVLVVTSESGWHVISDWCMVRYMREAGMKRVEHVKLGEVGIKGNGHMFFMEKNNIEIVSKVVGPWVAGKN